MGESEKPCWSRNVDVIVVTSCQSCYHAQSKLLMASQSGVGRDEEGEEGSSFWGACVRGDTEVVQRYLDAGQDPSEVSPVKSIPPVVIATVHRRTDVLAQLVRAGAKVNERDRHDRTPMHYAAGDVAGYTSPSSPLCALITRSLALLLLLSVSPSLLLPCSRFPWSLFSAYRRLPRFGKHPSAWRVHVSSACM